MVQGALTDSVLQDIAGRIGCAPEAAKRVVALVAPALIGSMMNRASSIEGARSLYSVVMSPAANALIAEDLPHVVAHADSFKALVDDATKLDHAVASRDSLDVLASRVGDHTGVSTTASRTLTGVVCATIFGLLKRHFSLQHSDASHLPGVLGHQLPAVRANLTDSFASALGLGSVGAFIAGVASRLKAVTAHLEHPATHEAAEFPRQSEMAPVSQPVPEEKASRKRWWWIAVAAALALLAALIGRGCTTEQSDNAAKPEQEATPAAKPEADAAASAVASAPVAAPTKDSTMSFVVDPAGVPTLTATVNSEDEKRSLIDALSAALGADKFHANITVDSDTKPASWLSKLQGLLPLMAVPGAQAQINGDKIDLSGSAADAKLGWLDKLKALFGAGWTITTSGVQAATAANADDDACAAGNIAKKLSLQPVNFNFASNTLPQAALKGLAESAKSLKECQAAGKPIKLQIGGYTDNVGDAALNARLSEKRAEAVRAYLVRNGVSAETLTAQGFGEASPIADNATAAGRTANRRIEFKQVD
ncbi:outer membrane porin OmpA/MotB family [Caballeronia insecticola]|uniref:Outer membrane porin OmpA/MotB family n=2 Tax=Caballeronia insecticola TaxID=758793 RepID=R4WYQ2_9BURK|nr:outer membrane porin OmpA/MotB family [Caballeronia insecticola]